MNKKFLSGDKNLDTIILNKLEDVDLVKTCQVNKKADEICKDQAFWFQRVVTRFPKIPLDILRKYKGDRSWSDYYIQDLRKINQSNASRYLVTGSADDRLDYVMIARSLGTDIHIYDDLSLINASANGYLEVVKYLINSGADIHTLNDEALANAASYGHLDVVKYLVGLGADVHSRGVVRFANRGGHMKVVDYLVSQGAPDPRQ